MNEKAKKVFEDLSRLVVFDVTDDDARPRDRNLKVGDPGARAARTVVRNAKPTTITRW